MRRQSDALAPARRRNHESSFGNLLPEIQQALAGQGGTAVGSTLEEFAAYVKSELAKWGKVLKASGVKAD